MTISFLLISQMSGVKSSSTNLGSWWAVTLPRLSANELLADGMMSSNCQHVTTKGHLETESGWPIDKSSRDCLDWSLRAHRKWHHSLGWAQNYITLEKAGWESEEVSWMCLFLSSVDYGGDLISCYIFTLTSSIIDCNLRLSCVSPSGWACLLALRELPWEEYVPSVLLVPE